ncbi:class I SAM-dependent methyltransferase [Desulfovibrio sp. JC022]|uniref:class I SAM-dependent methyltransferase n=1 Tax=Desulfovibrio sp. JC022 TaxID=2593642 RepID=UPI0013D58AEE|nr:class I SAM-dependent methyltransferase [Desulfovibrio sp. JC022]NDV22155.1 methyltransferase domain-containing protein [Desulfovibrio sp. JC022]
MIKYTELEELLNSKTADGFKILEVGSRPGCYEFKLNQVTHVESNIDPLNGLDIINSGDALPFKDNSFDMVFMVAVDYYVKNHELLMMECHRVLKGGGKLVIASYKESNLKRQVAEQDIAIHSFGLSKYRQAFSDAGFKDFRVETIINNPPLDFIKRTMWHCLPRFILRLRSQWRIYSGIK